MEKKKDYITPTLFNIGPDIEECMEANTPITAGVSLAIATTININVLQRIW